MASLFFTKGLSMDFYYLKDDYINYLRAFDKKVAENKNESRPYIGIVLSINQIDYFAPFTSPKPKHLLMRNTIDFRKINGGKLGAININNMIPVVPSALIHINIFAIKNCQYRRLMQMQWLAIKKDEPKIIKSASALRRLIFSKDESLSTNQKKIKERCCNLVLLEQVYSKNK